MKLKRVNKYIFSMISMGCISLVLINLYFKDNNNKSIEDKTNRIIIESHKNAHVLDSKENISDAGTRVSVSSINEKAPSSAEVLPVPDFNAPIVITLLK